MLFDRRCAACGAVGGSVCGRCRRALLDRRVAQRAPGDDATAATVPAGVDELHVLFRYDPLVARLVLAAKNGARRDVLALLGSWLAREPVGVIDVVTWVPASVAGRRRRRVDQGRVLATAMAAELGVRARPHLARRGRRVQANASREQRLGGPDLSLRRAPDRRILLVDDVCTTGASLAAAARLLRAGGARRIVGAVVARADGPGSGRRSPHGSAIVW